MKHCAENAFTLVELMVVVALIAIITALVVPEMKGTYEDELLRSTGRALVNVFNLACSRAVSFNQINRVRINPNTGHYAVERRAIADGAEVFIPLHDIPGSDGKLDSRIRIETGSATLDDSEESARREPQEARPDAEEEQTASDVVVTFNPDGTADGDSIVLRDREGFRLALRVNPITARVRVIELARASAEFSGAGE